MNRVGVRDPNRPQMVGLKPRDTSQRLRAGAQITAEETPEIPARMLGHISSITYSPELGHWIALAFLERGHERLGETVYAQFPLYGETVAVEVTDQVFVDPEGKRLHV
jgi:sarcosine oxidase subunit alpha